MTLTGSIAHSSPDVGAEESAAVAECLASLGLKGGVRLRALEERIAADHGYAWGVGSTTCGQSIQLLLLALFGGRGATVGLPSYLCRSVHDAIVRAGCVPRILDISRSSFSVDPGAVDGSLDAVVVPHMFGIRAPVEEIVGRGPIVIEDCAQRLAPRSIAAAEPRADYRVFSFEATKVVTCGEGGMVLGDDTDVLETVRQLRDGNGTPELPGMWLPMSDVQASIAAVQWSRLDGFLERRRQIAHFYLERLSAPARERVDNSMLRNDTYHFRFLLSVADPRAAIATAAAHGVAVRMPVAPLPLHEIFGVDGAFPETDAAMAAMLSLPIYPRLTDDAAERVAEAVEAIVTGER